MRVLALTVLLIACRTPPFPPSDLSSPRSNDLSATSVDLALPTLDLAMAVSDLAHCPGPPLLDHFSSKLEYFPCEAIALSGSNLGCGPTTVTLTGGQSYSATIESATADQLVLRLPLLPGGPYTLHVANDQGEASAAPMLQVVSVPAAAPQACRAPTACEGAPSFAGIEILNRTQAPCGPVLLIGKNLDCTGATVRLGDLPVTAADVALAPDLVGLRMPAASQNHAPVAVTVTTPLGTATSDIMLSFIAGSFDASVCP